VEKGQIPEISHWTSSSPSRWEKMTLPMSFVVQTLFGLPSPTALPVEIHVGGNPAHANP
jgi:hypothetical protein